MICSKCENFDALLFYVVNLGFNNDKFIGNEKEMNTDLGIIKKIADMVYGTNYVLYVTLEEDGSVNIDHEDYDCGW